MTKKILQICAYAAPYPGNFIASLLALEKKAMNAGYETIYCFPYTAKSTDWCEALSRQSKVILLPLSKARINPKTYFLLHKIFIQNPDIEIAHSHFELYDIPLVVTAPKNIRIFWHVHDAIGNYLHGLYKVVWKIHYGWFSRKAMVLSVSEKHLEVVKRLGVKDNRIIYVPNAIETQRIKQVNADRKTDTDLLIMGWDYYRKGVDLAVNAVSQMGINCSLGIIGLPYCSVSGSHSNIINITPSNDINLLFSSTKCFLHISRAEGLSYALLEAIYAGLPVIVSDIKENLIAKEFPTAIIVRSESVEDIKLAIQLLKSKNYVIPKQDVEASRKIIESKYSIEVWVKRILELYFVHA